MTDTVEYPYRVSTRSMLLGIVFFGACAAGLARAWATNDRELIINGLIRLSVERASVFYACLAVLSLGFVAAAAWALMAGRSTPRFVRLTPTELSAPRHGFTRRNTVVRVSDIRDVSVQSISGQALLTIVHAGGSLTIPRSMLPDSAAFDRLCGELGSRVQRPRLPAEWTAR